MRTPVRPTPRARRPWLVLLLLAVVTALAAAVAAPVSAHAAPKAKPSITVPVTGSTADGTPVEGTYKITRFAVQKGELVAKGVFTGSIGSDDDTVRKAVTIPVSKAPAAAEDDVTTQQVSCDVLNLLLGPLDLNLLGLRVQLNQVDLDITAEQGPGNLLGNLLCAVAGLLDGPAALNTIIAQLLTYILGIIG